MLLKEFIDKLSKIEDKSKEVVFIDIEGFNLDKPKCIIYDDSCKVIIIPKY